MKSRINIIIYMVYTLVLLILSFNYDFINNINLALSNTFENYNLVYNILKYTEIIIVYVGYGICVTLFCIDMFNEFKYILIYSILLSILTVIIDLMIKSFIGDYQINIFISSIICVIIGVAIEILVKIKQVKGGNYEK